MKKSRMTSESISTVLTALIFVIAGAVPIFTAMGVSAGLTAVEITSLLMCGMFAGGIMSVYLSRRFKMPVYAVPSITAVAVAGPLLQEFSLGEMVFGYLAAGAALFLMGRLKLIGKIIQYVPIPIVLAMVAGVYMNYGLNLINGVGELPLAGGCIVAAYFLINLVSSKVPPQAAALVMAIAAACLMKGGGAGSLELGWSLPVGIVPVVNLNVLVYVSLPLVIMAVSDLFKGYGVLKANGYDLPLDEVVAFCGIGSMIVSFGLSHTISLAGPTIAILAGENAGKKEHRYFGSMVLCGITAAVALLASIVTGLVSLLPAAIIDIVCGLAMIGLLTSSLTADFGEKRFVLGALTAFVVGLSHLTILGIGAPVWAIVFGISVSFLTERKDFQLVRE